ncbi:MAG: sigma-70 family RNA polymerase sigma factor [Verrucomicrobiota bacterium]
MTQTAEAIDSKAFEILIRQHHRKLIAYAITLCNDENSARDIVQEAFLTAYKALEKFDPSRDFGAWMRGIVRNKFKEWVRKQAAYTPLSDQMMDSVDEEYHRLDQAADGSEEIFLALRLCMKKLPDLMGKAVELFYMKRMSGQEVARELEVKEPVVRKRLQRAREQLSLCVTSTLEVKHG